MSNSFTYYRKSDCPICRGNSRDCRQSTRTKLVHCRGDVSSIPPGWASRGQDSWGFEMYAESSEQQDSSDWLQRKQDLALKRQRAKEELAKGALASADRDQAIRRIHGYFGLAQKHRQNLLDRGLSKTHIERLPYFSFHPNKEVPHFTPANLPGVRRGRLTVNEVGFACPIPDIDGQIIGWQNRFDDTTNGKYRWPVGERSSHLPNGELPIGVYRPDKGVTLGVAENGSQKFIGHAEGFLKADIIAQKWGLPVLGAASANFAASSEQWKLSLEKLSTELETKHILWFADAGSVKNQHVIAQYQKAWEKLNEWGYFTWIAWYNQIDKSVGDADEIPQEIRKTARLITIADYFKIADECAVNKPKSEIQKSSSILRAENGVNFRKIRDSQEELLAIFPEIETKEGKDWLKMRQFTPDIIIGSKYFDWEPDESAIEFPNLAVKSGLGTGKTVYVHNKFLSDADKGATAFGYRNALLIQFCERGNETIKAQDGDNTWYHLQTDLQTKQEQILLADERSRVTACADSLPYFQPDDFEEKRLVLDEVEGTFKHLYQSQTAVSYKRSLCKTRMGQAIEHSEATIMLDGNLTDITVSHAERISGRNFLKIENKYKDNRGRVTLYAGSAKTLRDKGETQEHKKADKPVTSNDYSLLHRIMLNDTEPLLCGSDSQQKLESWEGLLKDKGHKVFRLDGTNSNTLEAKKCIANPAKYIIENQITAFLYSPTAESGLSIDLVGYFKRSYFFFFGTVLTNEQCQFIARGRDAGIEIHIFSTCKALKNQAPQVSDEIQKFWIQYHLDCAEISLSDLGDEEKNQKILELTNQMIKKASGPHYLYECQLLAKQSFESANLRKCLEYALREAGYTVEVVTGYKVDKKDLEAAQHQTQIINSEKIVTAKDITAQEEKDILKEEQDIIKKFESPQDAKRAIAKRRLLERLPGIEQKTQTKVTYVEVPAEVVKDIEAGQVSPEIAQKLGVSIPEPKAEQAIDPVHLPQNNSIKPDEGGQLGIWDTPQPENAEKSQSTEPETLTDKAVALVHLPQNIYIKPSEGGQAPDTGMVRLEVTQNNASIFDTDFVHRVLYQNRNLIPAVELHFLLNNPDIAKLLQQRKWYKKLDIFTDPNTPDSAKNISLTTYRSHWLKVDTLIKMGIEFFLKPGVIWTDETPEAISFWEKGKNEKIAKYIGVSVGKDGACAYIGRVLKTLDIKTKSKKLPKQQSTGKRPNSYRIDQDYLDSPMRKAIYECVEESITKKVESADFIIDWDSILRNQQSLEPETLTDKAVDLVHLPQNISIKTTEGGQATDTDLDFCLSGLATLEAALESPESSSLTNSDKVSALFSEMEMREERCNNKLSESFWNRAVRLVSLLFERFESKKQEVLSTQDIELSNEDDEEEDIIVTNPRTFIYKGKDYSTHTFNNLGRKIAVTIAQGTVLKEVLGADMCDLLWTTVTTELLNNLEPITVDFNDLQLVQ